MKPLFLMALLCAIKTAFGANYYFSSTLGDDSRSSAQAQNPATPWRSIDKLNSIFSSLNPGDAVYFRRGEIFYGSIRITKSGTSTQPITISAYDQGNRPVITGLTTFTNWVSTGNGIWESYNPSLGNAVNMVLLNNTWQEMGRYPNSNAPNKGFLHFESVNGSTSITDNELTATPNWTGAEVVMRKRISILDRNTINSHSGNTIFYTSQSVYYPVQAGFGYFIQNDIKTLDRFGEWYYNPTLKKMYIYSGTNPSSYVIQGSSVDNLVSASNQSNIVFDNLELKGANQYGFNIQMGSNIIVRNCSILFSGSDGVMVSYHNNFRIEGCAITNSNNNGMNFQFGNTNAVIRSNRVENSYVFPGMGKSGDGNGIGINGSGPGNLIEYNAVINSGYIGISYQGNNAVVKNNYVDGFCTNKDDGGGIYTWVGDTDPTIYSGRKIIGNIILNGVGAPESTPAYTYRSEGISLDDFATGVEIRDNTIANCSSYGIYYRNASNIILDNNTFYNNKVQLYMLRWKLDRPVINNQVTNNIFFSKKTSQLASSLNSVADDMPNLAAFDNNYYVRPFNDKLMINSNFVDLTNNAPIRGDVFDLESWKVVSQKEGGSRKSPVQYPEYTVNSILGPNLFANGDFSSGLGNVFAWSASNSIKTAFSSGKLDGGAIQAYFTSPTNNVSNNAVIYQQIGAVTAGKKYRLKFSMVGASNTNVSLGVYIRQNNSPWNKISDVQYFKISTTRTENEAVFSVPITDNNASLYFEVNNQNVGFWLDNIELNEVNVTMNNPDDYIRFEYNPTQSSKTVALSGNYLDAKNTVYSGSVTLAPYSSVILMKQPGSAPVAPTTDNIAPTILTKNATVYANSSGLATITASDVVQSITDNTAVDNASIQVNQTQFTCLGTSSTTSTSRQAYIATATQGNQSFSGELGMEFSVNSTSGIVINQLGAFDHNLDGIHGTVNGGVRVAIFNKATRTIVPGLDVTISGAGDQLKGNHRMRSVTPVTLQPGEYAVVAKGYGPGEWNGNGTNFPAGDLGNGTISYKASLYGTLGSGFAYPASPDGSGNRYLAGSFIYTATGTSSTTSTSTGSNTYTVTVTAKDIYGNMASANATVSVVCGQTTSAMRMGEASDLSNDISADNTASSLTAYPNPTEGQFTVQLSNPTSTKFTVQILNATGAVIEQREAKTTGRLSVYKTDFNLGNKAAGVYFVRIVGINNLKPIKVTVQK
jgi:parallel beta-helix repeat protein